MRRAIKARKHEQRRGFFGGEEEYGWDGGATGVATDGSTSAASSTGVTTDDSTGVAADDYLTISAPLFKDAMCDCYVHWAQRDEENIYARC